MDQRIDKKQGGSSPNETLATSGGYTSLFISCFPQNFHIKRNELQLLTGVSWPPYKPVRIFGVVEVYVFVCLSVCVCVRERKRQRREEGGGGGSHV